MSADMRGDFRHLHFAENKVVISLRVMPPSCFLHEIVLNQRNNRHFTATGRNLIVNIP